MTVKWLESPLLRREDARDSPGVMADRQLSMHLGALALIALLMPFRESWAAQISLMLLLLTVPGVLLLRALRIPGSAVAKFPIYVPCASLLVLLFCGLSVDVTGLLTGFKEPLRPAPLLVGLELICVVLLISSVNAPPEVSIPWRPPTRPMRLMWPMVLPMLAAAGALRLNSGHSNTVAVISLGACTILLVAGFLSAPRLDPTQLAVILFACGLALMWSFSLRGDLIYGYDIATEYQAMEQIIMSGIWHPAHPGDAYAAMLSVTVLPAELHAMSGMTGLVVFKAVYPALGALFPVAVFYFAWRLLSPRWAFAAGGFIVAQQNFFQTVPALARQEIALLLFAGLIVAMLDGKIPQRSQLIMIVLLALGMTVSHYSTTYLAISMVGLTLLLQWIASWFRPLPRVSWPIFAAFAAALIGAFLWYWPITNSASNATTFGTTLQQQGLNLLPGAKDGNLITAYLNTSSPAPHLTPNQYAQMIHQYYAAHKPYVIPLPDAADPQYALQNAPPIASVPVRWQLGDNLLNQSSLILAQLTNLLAAIGAILLLWRRRTGAMLAEQAGLLACATLLILIIVRLSNTVAVLYGQERAFIQSMIIMAIATFLPLQRLAGSRRLQETSIMAIGAASLAILLASNSGLAAVALGGGTKTNLANSGLDYEQFDMTTPELASASWLIDAMRPGQLVYADNYGQLRIFAVAGYPPTLLTDITPLTIDQHAWVYATRTNVVDKQAASYFDNQGIFYAFPFSFLDANFDIVYTDGSSEVFHR
jgi:uncharacterized membrane protein